MEYLKEVQTFAGRVSAAADERLNRFDGGTYNEFFRLYSRRWSANAESAADDEQWQIDALLEVLRLAMEASDLQSAPSGTVLHTDTTEAGVGPALSQVFATLEKCLFFGAKGSAPDFWWVLRRVGGTDLCSSNAEVTGIRSSGGVTRDGVDQVKATVQPDPGPAAVDGTMFRKPAEAKEGSVPECVVLTVSELTRVQTGHGRCRAWTRGLLGLDGAAVEKALQGAARVAARFGGGLANYGAQEVWNEAAEGVNGNLGSVLGVRGKVGTHRDGLKLGVNAKQADPDAGGGSSVASDPRVTSADDNRDSSASPPPGNLPLWLRPGPQGVSILEDLCKFCRGFQTRLNERGLSVRPSLDHAWLDQENIAAATTYTWPRFPREELRCSVRGAGLAAANGKYYPVTTEKDEIGGRSLKLVGPNDCQISHRDYPLGDDLIVNPVALSNDLSQKPGGTASDDEVQGTTLDETSSVAAGIGTAMPPLTARLWCLMAPVGPGQRRRVAYSCLGDGALPPSRGWRAADVTELPSPLLGFATHTNGEMHFSGSENPTAKGEDREASEAMFGPVVPIVVENPALAGFAKARAPVNELDASAPGFASAVMCGDGLDSAGSSVHPRRRRKRRRPPGRVLAADVDTSANTVGAVFAHEISFPLVPLGNAPHSASGSSGGATADIAEAGGEPEGFCTDTLSPNQVNDLDANERRFRAERWTLPAPSGELLLRAERTRELQCRATEKRERILTVRRTQLLDQVAIARGEHQEVLQESLSATVARVLASRPYLREEAEAELAREARIESMGSVDSIGAWNGRSEMLVPTLEELVAEKAEELRTRPPDVTARGATPTTSATSGRAADRDEASAVKTLSPMAGADVGWPWPVNWLNAPLAPPSEFGTEGAIKANFEIGGFSTGRDWEGGPEDGDRADTPPYWIEVTAVEVADMHDTGAVYIEYVLRAVYREMCTVHENPAVAPAGGSEVTELRFLSAASRRLLQRTRVLRKRLNSLCALHPQLLSELDLEGGHLLTPGGVDCMENLAFPDPFELGTLEESILRVYRDPLAPRFKANPPTRKLKAQVGSYLSGVLHFLGILEATGHADTRARMSRVLNDALFTCDRAGRKRRRGDFILGVRIKDIAGGKLGSGKDDEQRLRAQARRCMGCGRAIAAEFLGIKKDYFPCRYANGLFCRRICHIEDRRVIPHRVVHHWDFTHHRVCKDSAVFLDATRNLPIINPAEECPRLVMEHEVLRLVRSRRKQLNSLRQTIFFSEEKKCGPGARILEDLLDGRMHLAEDADLYSMEDLIMAKKGSLLNLIEETVEALLTHVVDDCDACEARAARVCEICYSGDLVFTFQIGTTARCPNCGNYFHAKCAERKGAGKAGATGTKWWLDQTGVDKGFQCPMCQAPSPTAQVTE